MSAMLITGRTLAFDGDPFAEGPSAARVNPRGAVLVENGRVAAVGDAGDMRADHPEAAVDDRGDALISAGFVDAHVHYPQTAVIASWGKRLIDWLNHHTFPEEAKFGDPARARMIADRYLDLALSHGTTSMASFCTVHPESADAFFSAAEARGMAVWGGKTCMDRNAPEDLRDTADSAYRDSKALLERWHGRARCRYVVTPRFSPTSTPEQLEALAALWSEHPDCLMQTHLSEQAEEVAWALELHPGARDYLDTYEAQGLLREGAVFGHAIHLEPRERERIREAGAALAHCPTSNTFIGSGLFDLARARAGGMRVGLATDIGGGSSFSMLRTMAAAYEIGQLSGRAPHPSELWWLATEGSADALMALGEVGALRAGAAADLIAVDLASTPAIAQRAAEADTFWDEVFPTIMMGDDRAISGVWIGGREVSVAGSPRAPGRDIE